MAESNSKINQAEPSKRQSFMLAWFRQYYIYVTIGACALLVGLGYLFLLSPKIATAKNIGSQVLAEERTKQAKLEDKLKYLVDLDAKMSRVAPEDIARVAAMLPTDPGVPALLASLESIAQASQVVVESINLAKIEADVVIEDQAQLPPGVEAVDANLSLGVNPYSQVKLLVDNIENSLRLMDVISLLYSPSAKSYSLTVRSYYQP